MKARIYLFKNISMYPISSTDVTIPDGATEDEAFLLAAHKLMRGFRVELIPEIINEVENDKQSRV
jgi:hypothetical protein